MLNGSHLWSRAGAAGGIVFFLSLAALIALMPLSHSKAEPAFDAASSSFLAYAQSETPLPPALNLVGVAGLFGFAVFASVLAARFRIARNHSDALATVVLLTAAMFTVLWLAELGMRFGLSFRRTDLDATGASVLFGIANGLFVISWTAIAAFLLASGWATLWSRALPAWLGWSGTAIGLVLFLSAAVPLESIWFLPYFLFFAWVLAVSVVLVRDKPQSP